MFSLDEYRAVREAAGVIDRSGSRGRIAVSGNDCASYLQGLLTNDILALSPGTGCYSAYLTPQGRMISDMRVLHLEDLLLVDTPAATKDTLVHNFEEFIFTEDVQIADVSDRWTELGLHGPDAAGVLAAALAAGGGKGGPEVAEQLVAGPEHHSARFAFRNQPLWAARSADFGEIGFDLYIGREYDDTLLMALTAAGAMAVSPVTADVLRIEAGRPEFGVDMDEETIPLEAGIEDRAISFTKGCYVGQEVIIRVLHRGHGRVARKLVGLALEGAAGAPAAGDTISSDSRDVGRVTSAAHSPALGVAIALGYVHRDFATVGVTLDVAHDQQRFRGIVTALPFVRRHA